MPKLNELHDKIFVNFCNKYTKRFFLNPTDSENSTKLEAKM